MPSVGLADTANLVVKLSLEGNFAGGIANAERQLSIFSGTAGTKLTGALSHAGSQLKGLITGPLGMIGLAGGLFTVAGAIEKGITTAQSFGDEVRRLTALTGESAQTISAMAAAFDHFGIAPEAAQRSIGFLEKNIGLLAARKDGIAEFQKTFSFQLTDTNGKIKSANDLLLTTADYFNNKSIPATEKAAAISKLYGRSWQDLIPLLSAGRQGIADVQAEAEAMGLTLTQDNIVALQKMKTASREWGTALSGLELQIGLALVPTLTKLATTLTHFVTDHRTDIVAFFKNAVAAGKQLAGIGGDVIHGLVGAWNSVPPELRDFLVKGLVADRTIKFLFGFSPLGSLVTGIENALGKAVGAGLVQAGLGKLFVQPVFVTNPGFGGGLPGLPGVAAGAGEGAAAVGISAGVIGLAPLLAIALPLVAVAAYAAAQPDLNPGQHFNRYDKGAGSGNGGGGGFDAGSLIGRNPDHMVSDPGNDDRESKAIASYNRLITPAIGALVPKLSAIQQAILRFGYTPAEWAAIYERAAIAGGRSQINTLAREHKSLDAIALADSETSKFLTGTAGPFFRDGKNQTRLLASLEKDQAYFRAHGDTVTAARLGADIAALKNKPNIVNVTVPVNMYVTIRDYVRQQTIASHYGTVFGGRVVNRTYS